MHIATAQGDVFRKDCVSAAVCVVRHCVALPNMAFVRNEHPCCLQTRHRQRYNRAAGLVASYTLAPACR